MLIRVGGNTLLYFMVTTVYYLTNYPYCSFFLLPNKKTFSYLYFHNAKVRTIFDITKSFFPFNTFLTLLVLSLLKDVSEPRCKHLTILFNFLNG